MISEDHRRRLIAERCWDIYVLIDPFITDVSVFYEEFYERTLLAGSTYRLKFRVPVDPNHSLDITEEYAFQDYEIRVERYSYVLLNKYDEVVLRADPSPHHQVDCKGRRLSHFPHHIHDMEKEQPSTLARKSEGFDETKGSVLPFTGQIKDFVAEVKTRLIHH